MTLPTRSDIGNEPEVDTGSENMKRGITFERKELEKRFQRLHPHFRLYPTKMALLTRAEIGQHRKPEMSTMEPEVETGSGNRKWK